MTIMRSELGVFIVPGWAGLSFAVLEESWGSPRAHTQALVCCFSGLLVQADNHSLLRTCG